MKRSGWEKGVSIPVLAALSVVWALLFLGSPASPGLGSVVLACASALWMAQESARRGPRMAIARTGGRT
jgi:hypothetical protein